MEMREWACPLVGGVLTLQNSNRGSCGHLYSRTNYTRSFTARAAAPCATTAVPSAAVAVPSTQAATSASALVNTGVLLTLTFKSPMPVTGARGFAAVPLGVARTAVLPGGDGDEDEVAGSEAEVEAEEEELRRESAR